MLKEQKVTSKNGGLAGGNRTERVHSFYAIHIQYYSTTKTKEYIEGKYQLHHKNANKTQRLRH